MTRLQSGLWRIAIKRDGVCCGQSATASTEHVDSLRITSGPSLERRASALRGAPYCCLALGGRGKATLLGGGIGGCVRGAQ